MRIMKILRRGFLTHDEIYVLANSIAWALLIAAVGCGIIYYIGMEII
jgi:hypothetical protein